MTSPCILLFDVDGTLLLAGGAGRQAMERAFAEIYGQPEALDGVDFRGMTDGHIFRGGISSLDRPCDDRALQALVDAYLKHLEQTVASAHAFRVLPGVQELLNALGAHRHIATGLGTGNIEAGARIKLGRAELNRCFAFGGFGSDHDDRPEILRIGARRGAQRLGAPLERCRVVVIGDTPRDVAAARAAGADCVAVATGGHTIDALRAAGAGAAFEDLADPRALRVLLEPGLPTNAG